MDTIQEYSIGEFRGSFPDVPISAGVDLEALKELDANPLYVTLPIIPEVGAISKNGLLYDESLVSSIEEQINTKRPGGIFGHIKDADRSTAFPIPEGMWVGAKRDGNSLWAKAYIPPGAAREHLRRLKVMGGNIATSIFGKGDYEKVREGVRRVRNFTLESLDFAPPERAALGYGARPILAAEFEQSDKENPTVDKSQFLAELTAAEVPAAVREQIARETQAQNSQATQVAELTTQVKDRDTLISELQTSVAEFRKVAFNTAIDSQIAELTKWNVTDDKAKGKLAAFRRTLRSRIVAELGDDQKAEHIAEVAKSVWADLEPLAETVRDALAGPGAIVNGKVRGNGGRGRLTEADVTPEAMNKARSQFNF